MEPLIIICGPTAVGKSALAVKLARVLNGEIISADSQQVYRGVDIGTGKLPSIERAGIPHHLMDVVDPDSAFDAGQFVRLADAAIADIQSRGKRVIIVGGTGLYLKALMYGLVKTVARDDAYRTQLNARMDAEGIASLYAELQKVDPKKAAELMPRDKARIIRALEVHHLTGQPMSDVQAGHGFAQERYPAVWIGLTRPRAELVDAIHTRVDQMLATGWIDEVRSLLQNYGRTIAPFSAVGYREIADFLEGNCDETTLREKIYIATRQYSKRQMTWFRSTPKIAWFSPTDMEEIARYIDHQPSPRPPSRGPR
jgi:tRNA dimethylallyltransferase